MNTFSNWRLLPRVLLASLALALVAPAGAATVEPLSDLPITEVPAANTGKDVFAVLVSGDGGWAQLDQELSAELARRGIPVAGLSSLHYFWHARTPAQTAADVGRIIEHYSAQWHRPRVLLIGYSFGADVMPAVFNQLAPVSRARVASISLLGLARSANYEVSAAEWIPALEKNGPLVMPDVRKLGAVPVLCVEGEGETKSICPELSGLGIQVRKIGQKHHFSYREVEIADAVLSTAGMTPARSADDRSKVANAAVHVNRQDSG